MKRILIVDDSQIMCNILSLLLVEAGYEVPGNAKNGMEALKLYGELNPDLVTMDIQMEGGDGITYLKKIIQLDPGARVLMVSAQGHGQKEREALGCGAVGYLTKPFQKEDFLEGIRNALGIQEECRA